MILGSEGALDAGSISTLTTSGIKILKWGGFISFAGSAGAALFLSGRRKKSALCAAESGRCPILSGLLGVAGLQKSVIFAMKRSKWKKRSDARSLKKEGRKRGLRLKNGKVPEILLKKKSLTMGKFARCAVCLRSMQSIGGKACPRSPKKRLAINVLALRLMRRGAMNVCGNTIEKNSGNIEKRKKLLDMDLKTL
jgi:hypothetical protein